jgi:hypothetical protein
MHEGSSQPESSRWGTPGFQLAITGAATLLGILVFILVATWTDAFSPRVVIVGSIVAWLHLNVGAAAWVYTKERLNLVARVALVLAWSVLVFGAVIRLL